MESIEENIKKRVVEIESSRMCCISCGEYDNIYKRCLLCSGLHCTDCVNKMYDVFCWKVCLLCKKIYVNRKNA